MAKKKEFSFEKFEAIPSQDNTTTVIQTVIVQTGPSTKVTFDCPNELVEQMKDYGYWEGMSQKEIIIEALNVYFEDKSFKERPEKVKQRKKVGRKPKGIGF
ncbi:MAG: hypothetical protein MUF45_10805 [Spirosomaceae bacterium]|nr:hypothetical protein [Spirosomataceae bacterium]